MSEIHHECGVAAIYFLPGTDVSKLWKRRLAGEVSRLMPRMLQDIQNRGQLSAGMTTYCEDRGQLIDTHKEIGSVDEVFRLSHPGKSESLMQQYAGTAAIGHTRYATCGKDDRSYAQPFERHHLQKHKWFSFSFNGQLANYADLRKSLLQGGEFHLARDSDTEIIMHEISRELSKVGRGGLLEVFREIAKKLDGAYSLAYLDAYGDMLIARDPLGIKPMCYAKNGPLFAAASESVALANLGFHRDEIKSLEPGHAITIIDGEFEIQPFVNRSGRAHCFFEWIYFANVASTLDDVSVYLTRKRLGAELADLEKSYNLVDIHDENTIIVPVPDTSKAAADSMAYELGVPSREGLIRNRYTGRTFIQNNQKKRQELARIKYTPLREVLEGKTVILVEDSIVRSTTMKTLLDRIYHEGGAKEIHVRVACPPIVAPCFYGIDMSTIDELFAPRHLKDSVELTAEIQDQMAAELKCDSLRYLPVSSISRAIGYKNDELCQACIIGSYPTPAGQKLYHLAVADSKKNAGHAPSENGHVRTYEKDADVDPDPRPVTS